MIVIINTSIVSLLRYYPVFVEVGGYGYSGFKGFVMSICLTMLFYIVPFDKLPEHILRIIHNMTKYTMGIYCLHMLVGNLWNIILMRYGMTNTLKECVLIYVSCYIISYAISKIPVRLIGQMVN